MAAAPTSFVGRAEGAQFGQVMADILEYVPDLQWPQSVWVYSKMRYDPQLSGNLAAYTLPIRKADWRIDPAGCRPEVAQLVADDLGLPLLGADPEPQPARRRGVVWADHLRLAVPGHLTFGHYPFEKRYDTTTDPGKARLVEMAERVPASITQMELDKGGDLTGIMQDFTTERIDRSRLVWYVNDREGTNWPGRSILRAAYGAWLLKHEVWRVHATSIRRFGMGVPGVEAPPGATQAQIIEAQRLASSMRAGETAGMGLPPGFKGTLIGLTGSVPDALAFIRYLDEQMSTMMLAGVLNLGQTEHGSRALGDVFMDLLVDAVQSIGDQVAAIATVDVAVQLVDFNFGEDEPAPRVVCGDIAADREITVEALKMLLDAHALSADPGLEAYLRSRYHLPDRPEQAPAPAPARPALVPVPEPVAAARKPATALRRDPTAVEAASKADFSKVQAQWQSTLDKLVDDWADVTAAQVDDVVAQVESTVKAGDRTLLASIKVDHADGAALLTAAMGQASVQAQSEQRREAKAQGVAAPSGAVDTDRLQQTAEAIAALLAGGLIAAASRKALVAWGPESPAADVAATVRTHLESLTDASLRESLGGGITAGQNAGRIAVLKAGTAPETLAASEILDANTCEACSEIDGHVYESVMDAELDYAAGGYAACLGGARCRGILVAVWDSSTIEQAA